MLTTLAEATATSSAIVNALVIGGPICAFLIVAAGVFVYVWTKAIQPAMTAFGKTVEDMTKLSENVSRTAESLERMQLSVDARADERDERAVRRNAG